ncbi:hypothetical protein GCM10009740_08490 [Terrabacter terrae]|uniref:D-inositol 3-phosphate glycosyltransferase n=1 Tax=Terrabacter terrae TaxID=318434 RepID=A0ABN2TX40_9MICO
MRREAIRVAVVGSSGFIGSAVCAALQARGADILPIQAPRVRMSDSAPSQVPDEYRQHVDDLAKALRGARVVVNAAGISTATTGDRAAVFGANGLLPGLVGAAAKQAGVERFIHVSSAAVQGDAATLDVGPASSTFSAYSESKALGEALARSFGPLSTTVFRPGGVHGPTRKVTQTYAKFARSAASSVAGSGTANTPQALVFNVGDAIAFLATCKAPAPAVVTHPSEELTVRELAEYLGGHTPLEIPPAIASRAVRVAKVAGRGSSRLAAMARRLEILWFGQRQAPSWLTEAGWVAPLGKDAWVELGRTARRSPVAARKHVAVVASVPEQIRAQYGVHLDIWEAADCQVTLVVGNTGGDVHIDGCDVRRIPLVRNMALLPLLRATLGTFRVLVNSRPDLIVYGSPVASLVGALASCLLVRERWYVVHGVREETLSGARKRVAGIASVITRVLSSRTMYVSRSSYDAQQSWLVGQLAHQEVAECGFVGIDIESLMETATGTSRAEHRRLLRLNDDAILIGFVGRLARDKGIEELVAAVELLRSDGTPIELLLVGDYDADDVLPQSVTERISTSPYIHHLGHVANPGPWYSAMDALCLPSYREGLPTVVLEAGALGVPVIATRVTGTVDAVRDDEGWLCQPRSTDDLRRAIQRCLNEPSVSHDRAERHKLRMRANYNSREVRRWWSSQYAEVLK